MDLRKLRYFVAVAEELNFTRAAESLGMKQPPLSAQIRKLEETLGTPLFRRTVQGVELTQAGRWLLEEARIILSRADLIKDQVRRRGRGEAGNVKLGFAGSTVYPRALLMAIQQFRQLYPDISLCPEQSTTASLAAGLKNGTVDVAFVRAPFVHADGIAHVPLSKEAIYVGLPAGHRLGKEARVKLCDLADEDFIFHPRTINPGYHDWLVSACRASGFEPRLGPEASQIETAHGLVAAGFGIVLVAESMANFVRQSDVTFIPLRDTAAHVIIAMAYRRADTCPACRSLVSCVRRLAGEATAADQNAAQLRVETIPTAS